MQSWHAASRAAGGSHTRARADRSWAHARCLTRGRPRPQLRVSYRHLLPATHAAADTNPQHGYAFAKRKARLIVACAADGAIVSVQTASLGTYEEEGDAAKAYDAAHYEMYGRLDLLNFPSDMDGSSVQHPAKPYGRGGEKKHLLCWELSGI